MQIVFGILLALLALYLYYLLVKWFFFAVAPYLFVMGAIGMTGAMLFNYLRAMGATLIWGSGELDTPQGSEPAFRQYFFRKAWRDYAEIVQLSFKWNVMTVEAVGKAGVALFSKVSIGVVATWPLGVLFFAIIVVGAFAAAVTYVAFGITHLLVLTAISIVVYAAALLCRALEYASMAVRKIFLSCPHAGCYKRYALAVYACPSCGAEHRRLIPGPYGTFRRRCQCGQLLPTLFLFGRERLPSFCPQPECHRPLREAVVRPIHVPVVGGPSSGKTSFLMAALVELYGRTSAGGVALGFPDEKARLLFEACRDGLGRGIVVGKTAEYSPDAFRVALADSHGTRRLLSVYDAAGEVYGDTDELRTHEYYRYVEGLLFLVDPFSLPQVQVDLADELARTEDAIRPSAEPPQDVHDRMSQAFRELAGTRGGLPVAVVVTKIDACGLGATIRAAGAAPGDTTDRHQTDPASAAVRQWLVDHGEGNLVRGLEHEFKKVRYFACSALGRCPDAGSGAFTPIAVVDSLAWILEQYGLHLERPAAGTEIAA